jgi:hypothetical protein
MGCSSVPHDSHASWWLPRLPPPDDGSAWLQIRTGLADAENVAHSLISMLGKLAKEALGQNTAEHDKQIENAVREAMRNLRATLLKGCEEMPDPRISIIIKQQFCQALEGAAKGALKAHADEAQGLAAALQGLIPASTGIDEALPTLEEKMRSQCLDWGKKLKADRYSAPACLD